jgi:hypothetical protein
MKRIFLYIVLVTAFFGCATTNTLNSSKGNKLEELKTRYVGNTVYRNMQTPTDFQYSNKTDIFDDNDGSVAIKITDIYLASEENSDNFLHRKGIQTHYKDNGIAIVGITENNDIVSAKFSSIGDFDIKYKSQPTMWSKKQNEREKLLSLVEQGDSNAQLVLGEKYFQGEDGFEKDYIKAKELFKKSAEQGNILGQMFLADIYAKEGNDVEMAKWWRKAAQQGELRAQQATAANYYFGRGFQKDVEKALFWFKKIAEQGDAEGQKYYDAIRAESANEKYQKKAQNKLIFIEAEGIVYTMSPMPIDFFNKIMNSEILKNVYMLPKIMPQSIERKTEETMHFYIDDTAKALLDDNKYLIFGDVKEFDSKKIVIVNVLGRGFRSIEINRLTGEIKILYISDTVIEETYRLKTTITEYKKYYLIFLGKCYPVKNAPKF